MTATQIFFLYTVAKIFKGWKSLKLYLSRDIRNLMVRKILGLLEMLSQQKTVAIGKILGKSGRKNLRSK